MALSSLEPGTTRRKKPDGFCRENQSLVEKLKVVLFNLKKIVLISVLMTYFFLPTNCNQDIDSLKCVQVT